MVASIAPVASAAAATRYLENDGYYAEGSAEHQAASSWHGEGAAKLGMASHVEADAFRAVLEGHVPGSERRIGRMMDGKFVHKPGIDITFSAPKSFSMAALIGGDKRLIDVQKEAVRKTMVWAEKHVLVVRAKNPSTGQMERMGNQQMVGASFLHDTSRNLDPQIHSHFIVANMALGEDGKWRAIESKAFYENKMLLGAVYHNYLAQGCHEIGWETEKTGKNGVFELKDAYTRGQIEGFSTRWKEIQAVMRDQGLANTPEQAAQAALLTRQRKADIDRAALGQIFRDRAAALGVTWNNYVSDKDKAVSNGAMLDTDTVNRIIAPALSSAETLEWAIRHLEERNSVFSRRELLTAALSHTSGVHDPERYAEAIDALTAKGRLLTADTGKPEAGFTTNRAIAAEKENLAHLETARDASRPIMATSTIDNHLGTTSLTDGQQAAVQTILGSSDRIVGVQGYAGSGKTTMLSEMRKLAGEHNIIGLAPSASAARTLEQESGIASATLQHFLAKYGAVAEGRADHETIKQAKADMKDAIIVVDEASLASTMQVRDLMRVTEALDPARLVLVGDTKQLDAVDAGVPFRQLQHAGMETAVMDQIMRQRDPELRAAVIDALDGRPAEALERLGADVLQAPREELGATAAKRWLMLDEDGRQNTGLMAPTHYLREEINEVIRADLKRDALIQGEAAEITRLDPNRLTTAEKELGSNYQPGEVVIFERDLHGADIEAGIAYSVTGREGDHVLLQDGDGHQYSFDPAGGIADRVETYQPSDMELQQGDRIRWTRNDRELDLVNTHQAEITSVANGMVSFITEDGREMRLPTDAPQLQHADYAFNATVHAMQGRTADNVIAVLDATHAELTNQKTFYVEVSRARDRAIIITDNREQLAETLLNNPGETRSALQGIGTEPVTDRGMATEAEMAGVIDLAREMTLEDHEKLWAEIPEDYAGQDYADRDYDGEGYAKDDHDIDDEREYGFDEQMAESEHAPNPAHEPSKQREQELDFGM